MRSWVQSHVEDLPIVVVSFLMIFICPYTKVEESFNVQATHDILYHGLYLDNYDHLVFPGVVPRTFIGAIIISAISFPVVKFIQLLNYSKFYSLIVMRCALALLNCIAIHCLKESLVKKYGSFAGKWFIFVCSSQFHLMFYLGRPLPNVFALALITYAYSCYLDGKYDRFITCFTACCVIIRCDTVVLFCPILFMMLMNNRYPFLSILKSGLIAGFSSLLLSLVIDSLFWRHPLVPELVVLYYNTVLNKSGNWGTEPYFWYITSVLPRLFYNCMLFIPFGLYPALSSLFMSFQNSIQRLWEATEKKDSTQQSKRVHCLRSLQSLFHKDETLFSLFLPIVMFILLYSILPHKELRFILMIVPVVNVIAAVGVSRVWVKSSSPALRAICTIGYSIGVLLITLFFLIPSYHNYPGAEALNTLHKYIQEHPSSVAPSIHIDVYSAQTGISRYLEKTNIIYDKTEELTDFSHFSYLLVHNRTEVGEGFSMIGKQECYSGIDWKNKWIRLSDCVFIMKNNMY